MVYVSIVSHNQWQITLKLLRRLSRYENRRNLIVMVVANTKDSIPSNVELDTLIKQLGVEIRFIRNPQPRGFGANHNQVFKSLDLGVQEAQFLVLNPDITLESAIFDRLTGYLCEQPTLGVAAPRVTNKQGRTEDNARDLPSLPELFKKLNGSRPMWTSSQMQSNFYPDWVAGMFMMFSTQAFAAVGGFDERYHLYYEDVDICSRIWLAGYQVMVDPTISVIHDAQRTSHRNLRYLAWHLQSAAYFLGSITYRKARKFHQLRQGSGETSAQKKILDTWHHRQ